MRHLPVEVDPRHSARLRAAREAAGLTREEVEHRAGLPQSFLWEVEAYPDEIVGAVSLADLAALCGVIGIQPATLFVDEDERR